MTPEAVIFRYLEAAHRQPLSVEAFVRILSADADLLGRWLNLAHCPAEPEALTRAITNLRQDEILSLAQAQAWAVLPVAGSARLGLDCGGNVGHRQIPEQAANDRCLLQHLTLVEGQAVQPCL